MSQLIARYPIAVTTILLIFSNLFMTIAWYGHLKHAKSPLVLAIAVFTVFACVVFGQSLKWNYAVSYLLIVGAVYFAFKT